MENVSVEAVRILQSIKGVSFVIQRGERIRILSEIPSRLLAKRVLAILKEKDIQIHSIEYKVQIDMVDYFTYTTVAEEERRKKRIGEVNVEEVRKQLHLKSKVLPDGYGFSDDEDVIKTNVTSEEQKIQREDIESIREKEVELTSKTEITKNFEKKSKPEPLQKQDSTNEGKPAPISSTEIIWNANREFFNNLDEKEGMAIFILKDANVIKSHIEEKNKKMLSQPQSFTNLVKKSHQMVDGKPFYLTIDEYQQLEVIIQNELPELEKYIKHRYIN